MLRKRLFIKLTENEERLLLSASFTAKFEFPNVLCDIKHVNILMKSMTTLKLTIFIK